jgi:hypothetical protein
LTSDDDAGIARIAKKVFLIVKKLYTKWDVGMMEYSMIEANFQAAKHPIF